MRSGVRADLVSFLVFFGAPFFLLINLAVVCLAETAMGEVPKPLRGPLNETEIPNAPSTQARTVVAESTYNMGDNETPLVAEARAVAQAKRMALEQAGIYVQSYTRVRDSNLTVDEIEEVSAGFMEVEVLEKKRTLVREGIQVHVKVRCTIQLDRADAFLRHLGETSEIWRNTLAERQQRLQQDQTQLTQEVENLKDQLVRSKPDAKDQLASDLAIRQRRLEARELREQAYNARSNFEMNSDIRVELLSAAIALDPHYGEAWYDRGVEYWAYEKYKLAVRDLSEALRLGGAFPSDPHYLRGKAFAKLGQAREAVEDLTLCLRSCDLSIAGKINVYGTLGEAHSQLQQFDLAISDYTEIIDRLFPLYCPNPCRTPYSAGSYYRNRGIAYVMANNLSLAISDLTEALQRARTGSAISPHDQQIEVSSLMFRVIAHAKMGRKKKAIADLKAMKELCQPLGHLQNDKSGMLAEICTLPSSKFPEFVAAAKDDKEFSYRLPEPKSQRLPRGH